MPTFAATLKHEVRRLAAREIRKALRPLRRIQKQVKALRVVSRGHRRDVARLERRIVRIKEKASFATTGRASGGPRVTPEMVRSLRSRLQMTRLEFAKLLDVSPGSIFGWETGRTMPRGKSRARVVEIKKIGVREARSRVRVSARKARRKK